MPIRLRLAAALLLAATSPTHATGEPPRIEHVEIDDDQLVIEFDQPMLTWRGESDTAGLTLSPRVACSWYWEEDTRLACVAGNDSTTPFRAATSYRLQVPGGLWSQEGAELAPTAMTLVSSKPTLDARVLDWQAGQPELMVLSQDMPVTAADVARVLELRLDGALVAYTLKPPSARQRASTWINESGAAFMVMPTAWPAAQGRLVMSAIFAATATSQPFFVFSPVPTAVPPWASS